MTEASHAVFLSYASQDAEAAQRICEALRAAGIEVWFDQSELRGGDAWDQSIRKQIKTCALFLPVISQHTHERRRGTSGSNGSSRLIAAHLMDADKAFLVPVVIDDTRDDDERVPERFREVQWTRLPGGVTPRISSSVFGGCCQVSRHRHSTRLPSAAARVSAAPSTRSRPALALEASAPRRDRCGRRCTRLPRREAAGSSKRGPDWSHTGARGRRPATAFTPPPHSIAVLPFVNMSGDKEQEYFSDGLTEELLNSLSEINELQVAARTSSFSFKGDAPGHWHSSAQAERCLGPRRQRASLRAHHPDHCAAHQWGHRLSPVVEDLRP